LLPTAPSRRVWLHALPLLPIWTGALMGADWVGRPVVVWLLLAQVLIYAGCGLLLLRRQRGRLVQLAQRHRNTSYYWLLYLALGLFAATCFDLVINALAQKGRLPPQALLQGAAMVLALYVDLIALFAVYQPEIFVAEPPTAEPPAPDAELPKPAVARAVELSPEVARELAERLERLVQQHKPHQDEDMSLARLAALLDVTGHQLSELLNLHLGRSFYDYLNELRYREALQMLERPDPAQTLTVADIAYRAGFNNRNSFHKVFKDKTGLTPAQYRKAWRKQA
jgi:AraC-like DNA-binding protein